MPSRRIQQNRTYLYDTDLPVVLRLRGLTSTTVAKTPATPLSVEAAPHLTSRHILSLRSEEVAPAITPTPKTAPVTKPAELDFDAFAASFFQHLNTEDDTPVELPSATTQSSSQKESAVEHQLSEDDRTTAQGRPLARFTWNHRASKKTVAKVVQVVEEELEDVEAAVSRTMHRFAKEAARKEARAKKALRRAEKEAKRALAKRAVTSPFLFLHPSLRGIAVFVLLSFTFVLPLQAMNSRPDTGALKADLLEGSARAFSLLQEGANAGSNADFATAKSRFAEATKELANAETTLSTLGFGVKALASLLPEEGQQLKTGQALVDLGYELSLSAERVSDGLSAIGNLTDTALGTKLEVLERYVASALPHISAANEALNRINSDLVPEEHQATFAELRSLLPSLEENLNRLYTFSGTLKDLMGNSAKKRYLFVFQNDTEIRPTGGFIGSFAELDVYRGTIERIHLPGDGSYNLQGSLGLHVAAPKPLSLINARWEFQDANWFPDFSESAKKLLAFYTSSGAPTVDGVIAVNARFVADLLGTLGPIEMPTYGVTLTKENFLLQTQTLVETEYDREKNRPKQFLADLAPELLKRMEEADNGSFLPLLEVVSQGLESGDIQMFVTNTVTQTHLSELGWTGELPHPNGDVLGIFNANIGGQKTDAVITEDVQVTSVIQENGRTQNTVTITRRHHGIAGAPFTGANNVNYVQLYVPEGSQLIEVEGATPPRANQFETTDIALEEDRDLAFQNATLMTGPGDTDVSSAFGYTVFGNWTQTKPGQESTITFTYLLPDIIVWPTNPTSLSDRIETLLHPKEPVSHTLTLLPQSGMRERTVHATLSYPAHKSPVWTNTSVEQSSLSTTINGVDPGFLGIIFE